MNRIFAIQLIFAIVIVTLGVLSDNTIVFVASLLVSAILVSIKDGYI